MLNKMKSAFGGKKLLIGLGCLLSLVFAFPALAKEQSNKPANTPPNLEKITFVHYAKGANSAKPVWDDTYDRYKLLFGGVKWADTMQYEVNLFDSGFNSPIKKNQVMSTLSASLETWDSEISFELFDDTLVATTSGFNSGDGTNRITWGNLSPGIIALNQFWYNPALKVIVESNVVFSTGFTWSTKETCPTGEMDLRNIATHEFGHNGLNDLYSPPTSALTMYGYSGFGETDKRTLGVGDISGIQKLYGN